MKHTLLEVQTAALDDEGFCLACGHGPQPFVERRWFLGLCEECDRPEVMAARDILRVQELLDLDE
jgi:hypothetical protein